jgi:hypothetical protein
VPAATAGKTQACAEALQDETEHHQAQRLLAENAAVHHVGNHAADEGQPQPGAVRRLDNPVGQHQRQPVRAVWLQGRGKGSRPNTSASTRLVGNTHPVRIRLIAFSRRAPPHPPASRFRRGRRGRGCTIAGSGLGRAFALRRDGGPGRR